MFSRPGPRPSEGSCQNPWLAKIGLVEIIKPGEDNMEYNEGFEPEEVFRMDENMAIKRNKKENIE